MLRRFRCGGSEEPSASAAAKGGPPFRLLIVPHAAMDVPRCPRYSYTHVEIPPPILPRRSVSYHDSRHTSRASIRRTDTKADHIDSCGQREAGGFALAGVRGYEKPSAPDPAAT